MSKQPHRTVSALRCPALGFHSVQVSPGATRGHQAPPAVSPALYPPILALYSGSGHVPAALRPEPLAPTRLLPDSQGPSQFPSALIPALNP